MKDRLRLLKVMFVVSRYEINGVCTIVKNLTDNLDRSKFEIIVMAETVADKHFQLKSDVKMIDLGVSGRRGAISKLINIVNIIKAIGKMAQRENPDVVLSFGDTPNCFTLLALKILKRSRSRVIITEFSEGFFVRYKRSGLKHKISAILHKIMIYFLYRFADHIIPVSESISELIKKLFLIRAEKLSVIHTPVDIDHVKGLCQEEVGDVDFGKRNYNLGILSRLSQEKGIDHLIMAASRLKDEVDLQLLIIGEGDEESKLKEMVKEMKVDDRVQFLGWQENPFKYLNKCDLFVLPSFYEGFPNVILEAMASDVCVIASRCTKAMEEIIDDRLNGVLVAPRNSEALARTIGDLLRDKALREKIRHNARQRVKDFDVREITRQYQEVLINEAQ